MSGDFRLLQRNSLPAEVVVLLLMGLMMLILGILLFPVYAGLLPYYEEGLFSLLIIVAALQILALGKSPFGDVHRGLPTIAFATAVLIFGIVICFIPDIFGDIPRLLLILFFGLGGAVQLVQMYRVREEERVRRAADPLLGRLAVLRVFVYFFSVVIGVILIFQSLIAGLLMCAAVLGYGAAITALACVLRQVYGKYPPEEPKGPVSLSTGQVLLLFIGVFMVVLGVLLIPVNLGLLPFAPSSQLGLLLVIFSMQMMLLGETPVGTFSRSHLVVGIGGLLGVMGVICCLVPDVPLVAATLLVVVVNICGGVLGLGRIAVTVRNAPATDVPVPSFVVQMVILQVVMNVLTIVFGVSMLAASLLPGLVIGLVLALDGCVLLALLFLLRKADPAAPTAVA
ncbi:MAG: hypothetical protein MJ014_05535 [Methanocorpusculum sp.]|nr:hypothetical protein [Methanocorpusculum sp.]